MPAEQGQDPHICPRCRASLGVPFRAAPDDSGGRRVLLRCERCRHRWSLIEPAVLNPPEPRQG